MDILVLILSCIMVFIGVAMMIYGTTNKSFWIGGTLVTVPMFGFIIYMMIVNY